MKRRLLVSVCALTMFATPALSADKIKVGVMTTLSGPAGVLGTHIRDAAELALENLGGKLGGINAELVVGDDQQKPDVGVQVVERMLKKDRVDFMTGVLFANVLLAVYPQAVKANTILVGPGAAPSQLAGKDCTSYFFSTSSQGDGASEAMGKVMTDQGISDVYVMVPNYNSGKDFVAGFKRYFKGKIVDEVYTPLGQTDYQTEISRLRAANPKATFIFYPGGMGIQFIKQYTQAGLDDKVPLYSVFTVDETNLPALGAAADGKYLTAAWSPDLDNPTNRAFVSSFRKKYGYMPSYLAAQSYDAIDLIDSAVRGVKGNLADKNALIAAMRKAEFTSVSGPFKFNSNQFPIKNFYLLRVVKGPDGSYTSKTVSTVFVEHKDAYYEDCKMK